MNAPPPSARALTFSWPGRLALSKTLATCLLGSLLAHVATFFLFQVVYPQRATIPPPPPLVSLLTGSTPENRALLRWVAAEDPALVAAARSVTPPGIFSVPYRPSYATVKTQLRGSVEPPQKLQFPPAQDPLTLILGSAPAPPLALAVTAPVRTRITFSLGLSSRAPEQVPPVAWRKKAADPLAPLRALIGVNDRGEVRFAFQQSSPGDAIMDEDALAQIRQLTFARAEKPLEWGFAMLEFGSDCYARTAPAAAVP